MDGPMDKVNPHAVDNEVGNIWRQLYKLEKGFDNVPAAKRIATKVGTFDFDTMFWSVSIVDNSTSLGLTI